MRARTREPSPWTHSFPQHLPQIHSSHRSRIPRAPSPLCLMLLTKPQQLGMCRSQQLGSPRPPHCRPPQSLPTSTLLTEGASNPITPLRWLSGPWPTQLSRAQRAQQDPPASWSSCRSPGMHTPRLNTLSRPGFSLSAWAECGINYRTVSAYRAGSVSYSS